VISVVGSGRATAQPDIVRIRLTATAVRPTLAAALTDSEDAARRLRSALTRFGVPVADATTQSLSVQAEQTWTEQQGSRVTGFRSDHELAVTLRELSSTGRVLGEVLVAGGDDVRLGGVEFAIEDDAELRTAARTLAWWDAHGRASQLATLAGRPLGAVQEITEQSGFSPGPIMPVYRMAAPAAPEVGVQPGSVGVEVTLSVRWAID
jgi:uncharacterized protein YggE